MKTPAIPIKTHGIPVLGLGTWCMGGRSEHDPNNDDARDIQAIRDSITSGITHIDTAESYAAGHTETLISQAISGIARNGLFLASKVYPTHLRYDDALRACEASLARLKTDYLDLYYVHVPNKEVSYAETAKAFNSLLRDGRIKNVGVCNFSVESMKAFQQHLDAPIIANQSHYNLVYRGPERLGLLKHCQDVGAAFIAWRPLMWNDPSRTDQPKGSAWEQNIYPILDLMAARYGKPNVQVALNWLINQPNVCSLIKTSQKKHLEEILATLHWSLSSEDIEMLRAEFPDQREVSCAVPLQ